MDVKRIASFFGAVMLLCSAALPVAAVADDQSDEYQMPYFASLTPEENALLQSDIPVTVVLDVATGDIISVYVTEEIAPLGVTKNI